ncbi:alpha/beta hydrolase [Phenylobacterium sp. J426]|uniref:alpha/beta fold hydrolase n=1 Tax=Phenylobacterium sp. J426 TaxID=2898439 RepID=UPI002150FE04|nr:alpha/beta hydrolase [Phenylobacterium sp. J426]MCR5876394.1 alpha/beta hydrolase [Phenylobacterium sp. J426]
MNRRHILTSALVAGVAAQVAAPALAAPKRRISQIVARDGTRLHHRDFGAGPKTLVFTASWALDSRMWDYQVAHFAALGYRCIAWDRRGHGRSDVTSAGWDMDTLADDLAAVLEQLDLRDVILVGHSMGGAETIRYLARHGAARVRKAALIAPVGPFLLQAGDNPYGAPRSVFEGVWAQYAADFPKWAYENQAAFFTPQTSRPLQEQLTRQLLEVPAPVAIAAQKALITADLRGDLSKIGRPVLILHGDKDASAPLAATGARFAAGIRGAELKVYPGAPHGIWVTHLAQVNRDLEAFFGG